MIADSWRARWEHITPFLALPADLRRAVYTTNSIENLNRQIRKSDQDPRPLPRRAGRHQAHLPRERDNVATFNIPGTSFGLVTFEVTDNAGLGVPDVIRGIPTGRSAGDCPRGGQ